MHRSGIRSDIGQNYRLAIDKSGRKSDIVLNRIMVSLFYKRRDSLGSLVLLSYIGIGSNPGALTSVAEVKKKIVHWAK